MKLQTRKDRELESILRFCDSSQINFSKVVVFYEEALVKNQNSAYARTLKYIERYYEEEE